MSEKSRRTERSKARGGALRTIYVDLGNFNYKLMFGDENEDGSEPKELNKKIEHCNVERVPRGSVESWSIDDESYIISPNAELKGDSNKIVKEKRALLGRILYDLSSSESSRFRVVTLLPLSLYINEEDGNREAYAELLKGDYKVSNPNGVEKVFSVEEVEVFCESFSALAVMDAEYRQNAVYLVDLGGVDWSGALVYGTPHREHRFSKPVGMNKFYVELAAKLTSAVDKEGCTPLNAKMYFDKYSKLSDGDLEEIANESKRERAKKIKHVVDVFAKEYLDRYVFKPLDTIGYKEDLHKLVFIGGASKSFKKYILDGRDEDVVIAKDAIFANVKGARKLARARARSKDKSTTRSRSRATANKSSKKNEVVKEVV